MLRRITSFIVFAILLLGMAITVKASEQDVFAEVIADEYVHVRIAELEQLCDDEIVRLFAPFALIIHEINAIYGTNIMPTQITDEGGRHNMIQAIVGYTPESAWAMIELVAISSVYLDNWNPLVLSLMEAELAGELNAEDADAIMDAIVAFDLEELVAANLLLMEGVCIAQAIEMASPRVTVTESIRRLTSSIISHVYILSVNVTIATWNDGAQTGSFIRSTSNPAVSLVPGTTGHLANVRLTHHVLNPPEQHTVFVSASGNWAGTGFNNNFVIYHHFRNVV